MRTLTVTWPKLVGGNLDRYPLPPAARHGRNRRLVLPCMARLPRSVGRTFAEPSPAEPPPFKTVTYVRLAPMTLDPFSPGRLSIWAVETMATEAAVAQVWDEIVLGVGQGLFG